ncbi:hypothetical protein PSHT_07758 [Puccinia striiformis]|uniref:Uncharacterized protein n=1 Tax=Puccinia striiformis TaxID=27350 RepID=A0A2S4VVP9_9BASI|nr:hypothetical protein PSHT_07758 [Puccinia striiformis]
MVIYPHGEEDIPTPTPSSVQPPSAITADDLEELSSGFFALPPVLYSSTFTNHSQYVSSHFIDIHSPFNLLTEKATRVAANALSSSYKSISRPTSDSSCGNLNRHVATCWMKQSESNKNQTLVGLGIKGTGDINPREVNQLCAIWCAEAARPFSALIEASHKALLHPTIRRALPGRQTISTDIHMLYSAVQKNYKTVLETHTGALYLGVDAWQSPNGFDILGTVVYRFAEANSVGSRLEAIPLDFIRLSQSHTGEYLAHSICGIVSDNRLITSYGKRTEEEEVGLI